MDDILVRIKRAVLAGRYVFSEKARTEMKADDLEEMDVVESILNAVAIYKSLRSRSPLRVHRKEYLYVIQSPNLDGLAIYSKGKLVREAASEVYYFLVSSKEGAVEQAHDDEDYALPDLRQPKDKARTTRLDGRGCRKVLHRPASRVL